MSIIIHITLCFLLLFTSNFQDVFAVPTRHLCRPEQRDALLEFKNEFESRGSTSNCPDCYLNSESLTNSNCPDCYLKTESWTDNSDCCYWDGITCDTKSREVIEVDLSCSCLSRVHSNTSLFKLPNIPFLTTLDLSLNNLSGQIPSSVGTLFHLTSLDFSNNRFTGKISSSIGNLSHLTSLGLSDNQFSGEIPFSIGKLSHLTSLYICKNQFSGHIPSSIGNLSHLTFLEFYDNQFSGQIPSSIGKLSHLTYLVFSGNQFSGQIPSSIGNLSHLTSLEFSDNQFSGQIPSSIGKLLMLIYLDFSGNNFVGAIPSSFGSLNQLTTLTLNHNKLSGNLPIALLNLTKLTGLSLSSNQLTGNLPPNISLSSLEYIWADYNAFVGTLPFSLFTLPSLSSIFLTNNQLDGTFELGNISSPSHLTELLLGGNNLKWPIPRSLSILANLQTLDLSHCNIQGPLDFSVFSHLKSLETLDLSHSITHTTIDLNAISSLPKSLVSLDLSGNRFSGATKESSVADPPPLQLITELYLSGCSITEFPEFLRTREKMTTLDISNNKISGQVPGWLWRLPKLWFVNLSNNTFIGFERSTKHELLFSLMYLFGSRNNFTGQIPSFICELPSLTILDLSNNNFNGSIPRCKENFKSVLKVLNVRQNRLTGGLPENVFSKLTSLDVGHNQLMGKLPRSLARFSALQVLNVESNNISDTFPSWLTTCLQNLQILVLRNNSFHGPIHHHQAYFLQLKIIDISHNEFNGTLPPDYFASWNAMSSMNEDSSSSNADYMGGELSDYYNDSMILINKGVALELVRILKIYTALDFSGNRLEGEIPTSIGLLKVLHVLNLSGNAFNGHIPSSMGNLTALESLDLSQNKLSGEIPQELGTLSFLAYMNFSYNQLTGLVPGGTQFRRQPCSSFKGNSGLFGPALEEDCKDIQPPSSQQFETNEIEENQIEVFSWIAAAIGFVPGFSFGLTIGYLLVSHKLEWFTSLFDRNKRTRASTTSH